MATVFGHSKSDALRMLLCWTIGVILVLSLRLVPSNEMQQTDFPSFFAPKLLSRFETAPGSAVFELAFDYNGSIIASGTVNPSEVRLFSRDGSLLWKYSVGGFAAAGIALSADGRFLATGNDHDSLFLFSTNGTMLWRENYQYVHSVAMTADGKRIAFVGDHNLVVVDQKGRILWSAKPANYMAGVSMTPDGNYVAVLGEDDFYPKDVGGRLFLYDKDGKMLWYRQLDDFTSDVGARLSAPAISEDAKAIAVAGEDGRLRLFDRNGNLVWARNVGAAMGSFGDRVVVMSSDGRCIAVGTGTGGTAKVQLLSLDGVRQGTLETPELSDSWCVLGIGISLDGSYVAASPRRGVAPTFFLFRIPNVEVAVEYASRAISLGRELGANLSNAESQLRLAQRALAGGSLASAYDNAWVAYSMVYPLLRRRLEETLKEVQSSAELAKGRLQSFDDRARDELWKRAASKLEKANQILVEAAWSIRAGKLQSYKEAFTTLETAKRDISEALTLSELSVVERLLSETSAQVPNGTWPSGDCFAKASAELKEAGIDLLKAHAYLDYRQPDMKDLDSAQHFIESARMRVEAARENIRVGWTYVTGTVLGVASVAIISLALIELIRKRRH